MQWLAYHGAMSPLPALPGIDAHRRRFLVEAIREGNATNFHVLFEGWERESRGIGAGERKEILNFLLHEACAATFRFPSLSGTPSIVSHLLQAGADPDCRIAGKETSPAESCLLARVFGKRQKKSAPAARILKVLLEHGADPTKVAGRALEDCDPACKRIIEEGAARRHGLNLLLQNRKRRLS